MIKKKKCTDFDKMIKKKKKEKKKVMQLTLS